MLLNWIGDTIKFMQVVILCGGRGTRLGYEANYIPKAMVKIGHRPVVWHVMKRYALFGHTEFILALGSKGEMIRDYFTRYEYYTNDIKVSLGKNTIEQLTSHQETDWTLTMIDTGILAMSGARINRCKQYIEDEDFMITYSDSVGNVNIKKLIDFHKKSKKILTVTGVIPVYRAFEFIVKKNEIVGYHDTYTEKPESSERYINGGYMVCNKKIFSYLNSFNECMFEKEVFSKLIKDKQLAVYPHYGFWRWLDADRDYLYLNQLADNNKMYWLYE